MDGPSDTLDLFASLAASVNPLPEEERRRNMLNFAKVIEKVEEEEEDEDETTSEGESTPRPRRRSSVDSSTSSTGSSGRRSNHNFCERRRRQNIREAFEILHGSITKKPDSKCSKMDILRNSIDFIKAMQRELSALEAEVSGLRRRAQVGN